ncbi:MAG: OmpA family protein [Flavobacterium sp.]
MKYFLLILFFSASAFAQRQVTIFFDFDKSELTSIAEEQLKSVFSDAQLQITKIYGYCDWKGDKVYNDSLSYARVNSVYNFLKDRNVKMDASFEGVGFGKDFPQSKNQAENRKVTISFVHEKTDGKKGQEENSLSSEVLKLEVGQNIQLKNIFFYNNSARIRSGSEKTLYDLQCVLEENPTIKIEIQGHICCQLNTDVNDISTARAKAIYNFLIRNKINRNRLEYKGYGSSKPVFAVPEKSEEEANANRRVEIKILAK